MSIKPGYIYTVLVVALVLIVSISYLNYNGDEPDTDIPVQTQNIPNDDVHQGLNPNSGQAPTSSNVSSDFKTKMENLKRDIEDNPTDTLKMREYATMLTAAHKPEEGITYFEKILKIDPRRTDIISATVFSYFTVGKYNEAINLNKRLMRLSPNNMEAKYNQGVIKFSMGQSDEAIKIWKEIIEKAPGSELAKMCERHLTEVNSN